MRAFKFARIHASVPLRMHACTQVQKGSDIALHFTDMQSCHLILNSMGIRASMVGQLGGDCNSRRGGWTPLMWAAHKSRLDVLNYLLTRDDIDVGAADDMGRTALDWARMRGKADCVAALEAYQREHERKATKKRE